MIQPNPGIMQTGPYSGATNGSNTVTMSDEDAYRNWQTRREAARQQMRRLSRRELQVVALVAQGHANKSIAQQLEISVKTIEKHRANAARKLGVNSTADLVRITVIADQEIALYSNRVRAELSAKTADTRHLEN
ncbi:MAG: hypothetical protein JNL58_20175 [Planctomyces sp.]|nr:hypothetical protein [Planctomyces sp.]